ncbi:hypothetical protein GCM10027018_29860 [Paenibacillus thermoaerophilus]
MSLVLLTSVPAAVSAESAESKKLDEIIQMLHNLHLSAPGKEQLLQAGIRGMIDSLHDPYTSYMSETEFKKFMDSISRQWVGMGVVLSSQAGSPVTISEVLPGSPAEAAGLQPGDVLKAINGTAVTVDNLNQLTSGWTKGDNVKVQIERDGRTMERTIAVDELELPLVDSSRLTEDTGYIRILSFGEKTDDQVGQALADLKKSGKLSSLVIDLRDNPGGLLEAAGQVAGRFMESGVLAYIRDKDGVESPIRIENGSKFEGKVTLLVNGGTASASEVLAGALQDHGIAQIAGSKTYGKGVIQQVFALPSNGGYLKVTVQEYLTPGKHPVQGVGIKPDLTTEGEGAQTAQALRAAGVGSPSLTAGAGVCRIQTVDCGGGASASIVRDGRVYVPLRTVAALLGSEVRWNGDTRRIELTGPVRASFVSGGEGLLLVDGVNYVDLESFAVNVPGRKLTKGADGIWTWAAE